MPGHFSTNNQQTTQYLEYPSNIGSDIKHWISFTAFDFKARQKTLDIALYIPGDALNTSYKSDYETSALGSVGAAAPAITKAIREQGGLNVDAFKQVLESTKAGLASEGYKVITTTFSPFQTRQEKRGTCCQGNR